jgi:hypothetical protein
MDLDKLEQPPRGDSPWSQCLQLFCFARANIFDWCLALAELTFYPLIQPNPLPSLHLSSHLCHPKYLVGRRRCYWAVVLVPLSKF